MMRPRLGKSFVQTGLLVLLVFTLLLSAAEAALRSDWVQEHQSVPYPVAGFKSADGSFGMLDAYVREHGKVECIFLGSSVVFFAINPLIFAQAYEAQSGMPIHCVNFGVASATGSSLGAIAAVLANRYHPELIIFGADSRDYSGWYSNLPEHNFPTTPWAQYHLGKFNLAGWFEETFFSFRYLKILPQFLFDKLDQDKPVEKIGRLEAVSAHRVEGHRPFIYYENGTLLYYLREGQTLPPQVITSPYQLSSEDMEGFQELIQLAKKGRFRLLIVEMPLPDYFLFDYSHAPQPTAQQVFNEQIVAYARKQGIPFWTIQSQDLVEPLQFADGTHLYVSGSYDFSQWLGQQVGAAVRQSPNRFTSQPPLQTPFIERSYVALRGFSAQTERDYQTYLNRFNLLPAHARVLNPRRDGLSVDLRQTTLGFFIEWSTTIDDTNRQDYFDLRRVLDLAHQPESLTLTDLQKKALERWTILPLPRYLHEAEIDYLFYTELWDNETTAPDAILNNPDFYQLIKIWDYTPLRETYYLYRVK